jgi:hypothetical protein
LRIREHNYTHIITSRAQISSTCIAFFWFTLKEVLITFYLSFASFQLHDGVAVGRAIRMEPLRVRVSATHRHRRGRSPVLEARALPDFVGFRELKQRKHQHLFFFKWDVMGCVDFESSMIPWLLYNIQYTAHDLLSVT